MNNHKICDVPAAYIYITHTVFQQIAETMISDLELRSVLAEMYLKPLTYPQFIRCPASTSKHHVYQGGLLVHTAQVLYTGLAMLDTCKVSNLEILEFCVAVMFHDLGKILDYQEVVEELSTGLSQIKWIKTEHGKLITHLPASYKLFNEWALGLGLHPDSTTRISHMILAHHGWKNFGSPVEPLTTGAWALHAADMLSAQYTTDSVVRARGSNV